MKPDLTVWQNLKCLVGCLFLYWALCLMENSMTNETAVSFLKLSETINQEKAS